MARKLSYSGKMDDWRNCNMKVIQSNTKHAREQRADSYSARVHLDDRIIECPHWRYYLDLVHEIKRLSEVALP